VSRTDFMDRICRRLDQLTLEPGTGVSAAPADPGDGVIVCLSGGPDSVALLLAARQWSTRTGRPVGAAHLNHQLRAADSAADADFCRNLCTRLDVPYFEHTADPRPVARARGQGLEEAGRHLRRKFCEGLLAAHRQYRWLTTGHHRDDQTETVLMRLFRGTGPGGLRGIRPVRGVWLHPLLEVTRAEIVAFLASEEQPWRTDASNRAGDNVRARLRRELLPVARGIFGPGCDEAPARLAALLGDDLDLLEDLTTGWLVKCVATDGSLLVSALAKLNTARARRVLHAWLTQAGAADLARVHIENAHSWLTDGVSGSTLDLPGGVVLSRDFDRVTCQRGPDNGPLLRFAGDYRIVVQAGNNAAADGDHDPQRELPGNWSLTCPAEILQGNLRLRNWRTGDRFQPFGLQGTKKLSDLFREHQVAREDRQNILIVADDGGILWVLGLARAERTRLLPSTGQTVTISVVARNGSDPRQVST
jgi:tRNA(Ile)-lysidine synthase